MISILASLFLEHTVYRANPAACTVKWMFVVTGDPSTSMSAVHTCSVISSWHFILLVVVISYYSLHATNDSRSWSCIERRCVCHSKNSARCYTYYMLTLLSQLEHNALKYNGLLSGGDKRNSCNVINNSVLNISLFSIALMTICCRDVIS